jgi:hypothetical protein
VFCLRPRTTPFRITPGLPPYARCGTIPSRGVPRAHRAVSYTQFDPILPIAQVASVADLQSRLALRGREQWHLSGDPTAFVRWPIVLVLAGCAKRTPPNTAPAGAPPAAAVAVETGVASYYADSFQGRQTASGSAFDNRTLVAPIRRCPLDQSSASRTFRISVR